MSKDIFNKKSSNSSLCFTLLDPSPSVYQLQKQNMLVINKDLSRQWLWWMTGLIDRWESWLRMVVTIITNHHDGGIKSLEQHPCVQSSKEFQYNTSSWCDDIFHLMGFRLKNVIVIQINCNHFYLVKCIQSGWWCWWCWSNSQWKIKL